MSTFLQLLVNSLLSGAIYGLVASGFSLIYTTTKFVHFAHGAVLTVAAYIMYWLLEIMGLNFWFSIFLTIAAASILGLVLNLLVYSPLERRGASGAIKLIAGMTLLILLESIILLLFGANVRTFTFVKTDHGLNLFGAVLTPLQLLLIVLSILALIGLTLFMNKTKLGKGLKAVANNQSLAKILGISPTKIWNMTFLIGSGLAGLAGILIGFEQNLEPLMGANLIIKAFTAAIIGGIDNIQGAFAGALLLALAEGLGVWIFPSGYKDAVAFMLLFAFLLWKPQGIFSGVRGSST